MKKKENWIPFICKCPRQVLASCRGSLFKNEGLSFAHLLPIELELPKKCWLHLDMSEKILDWVVKS